MKTLKTFYALASPYWLETTSEDTTTSLPQAKQRRLGYVATLEVLPQ